MAHRKVISMKRKHTHLIPIEKRQAVVVRMTKAGKPTGVIAYALGWTKGEGYGMVKRLQIAGKVRKATRKGR
jgi:hypothetical protein